MNFEFKFMHLTYLGHACFKMQDKIGPDGVTVITDPFDKTVGLPAPHCEANIVTVSHNHNDHNNIGAIRGNPFVIDTAGEYDIKGVMIEGVDSYHDKKEGAERGKNIIYRIEIDDIVIAHLGDLGHSLNSKQLEKVAGADILLIPVGGIHTLNSKEAVEVVAQIEPRIVIPMHYRTKESRADIEGVEKFIKEIGLEPGREDKLKISKKDLPAEEMRLVVMNF